MMIKSTTLKCFFLATFVMLSVSCGDNSSGTTETPDPPQMPDLQQYKPDTGFFPNQFAKEAQDGEAFQTAAMLVHTVIGPQFLLNEAYLPFFNQAEGASPEYENGTWEWNYSYSYQGQSVELNLMAENSSSGEILWSLYISANTTQGPSFENYKFMDGTTSEDGSSGSWNIYNYDPESPSTPVVSFQWERTGDESYTSTFEIFSSETFTISFVKSGVEHTVDVTSNGGDHDFTIYWNTETQEGYLIQSDMPKQCWDSNFDDVACQ